jgi:hypothetical protein
MRKYEFKMLAIDLIDGLDNNFYVIDVNGLVGVQSILKHKDIFHTELRKFFDNNYSFECSWSSIVDIVDFDLLNEGLNLNSLVIIENNGFIHEDKLEWRKIYNFPAPAITLGKSSCLEMHDNPDYPKFLTKPNFSFGGMGIELHNTEIEPKEKHFVEKYIPGKLIDGHCYHSRLIIITNEYETLPILRLNKLCSKPIIRNLKQMTLSEDQSYSYISNKEDEKDPNYFNDKWEKWILNTDDRFEKFSLELVDMIKSVNNGDNPWYIEEIKEYLKQEQTLIDFLSKF